MATGQRVGGGLAADYYHSRPRPWQGQTGVLRVRAPAGPACRLAGKRARAPADSEGNHSHKAPPTSVPRMTLIHCIYASAASRPIAERELQAILEHSRVNNAGLDITGMLLHVEGSFFQVLEGPAERVAALFDRISQDERHEGVVEIIREPLPRRAFGQWSMGFVSARPPEVLAAIGGNDFFGARSCLEGLDAGRAKKLLTAFARGRWRRQSGSAVAGA